jgi:hypothetical protein
MSQGVPSYNLEQPAGLFDITLSSKAIYAGLECGILKSKQPNTDILLVAPTIRERIRLLSVSLAQM